VPPRGPLHLPLSLGSQCVVSVCLRLMCMSKGMTQYDSFQTVSHCSTKKKSTGLPPTTSKRAEPDWWLVERISVFVQFRVSNCVVLYPPNPQNHCPIAWRNVAALCLSCTFILKATFVAAAYVRTRFVSPVSLELLLWLYHRSETGPRSAPP